MHVAKVSHRYRTKSGEDREYVSHQLRRTFREGGKVTLEPLTNLSALPIAAIEAVRAVLAGKTVAVAGEALTLIRSLPHGHAAAVWAQAKAVGPAGVAGPAGRARDVAMALVVARVVRPASKLATARWWTDTTLAADLGVADASRNETYAALDDLFQGVPCRRVVGG